MGGPSAIGRQKGGGWGEEEVGGCRAETLAPQLGGLLLQSGGRFCSERWSETSLDKRPISVFGWRKRRYVLPGIS